jgi:hypothetical protein
MPPQTIKKKSSYLSCHQIRISFLYAPLYRKYNVAMFELKEDGNLKIISIGVIGSGGAGRQSMYTVDKSFLNKTFGELSENSGPGQMEALTTNSKANKFQANTLIAFDCRNGDHRPVISHVNRCCSTI